MIKRLYFKDKVYNYELTESYIIVNGKKMKVKAGLHGYTYKLNATCISCESPKDLIKWMKECIEDRWCLVLITTIFEHVIDFGERV